MIKVLKKVDCCGCGACEQICSKKCIILKADKEGFLYPAVSMENCIKCGRCIQVCPIKKIRQNGKEYVDKRRTVYAAYNKDEDVRRRSSSGGVFSLFADYVLEKEGVVFGAAFDKEDWSVIHTYIDNKNCLDELRRSKYVQSIIGNSYRDAERFLKNGRLVLFSGTPCQIAGLKSYLCKEYDNLITIDCICHGVPSPMVWKKYLREELRNAALRAEDGGNTVLTSLKTMPFIKGINFREKSDGWRKFRFVLTLAKATAAGEENSVLSSPIRQHIYMNSFLDNRCLRPSCHHCYFRKGKSGSDITLGDFWGVQRIIEDVSYSGEEGTSLVIINNPKYNSFFKSLDLCVTETDLHASVNGNPAYYWDLPKRWGRSVFFKKLNNDTMQVAYGDSMEFDKKTIFFQRIIGYCYRRWNRIWQK